MENSLEGSRNTSFYETLGFNQETGESLGKVVEAT
jgi:hypothetical protein